MKMLTELLEGLEVLDATTTDLDIEIRGISDDSRELCQGDAFVAVAVIEKNETGFDLVCVTECDECLNV